MLYRAVMKPGQDDAEALVAALEQQLQFWGGELHDGICQSLAGTTLLLEMIRRTVASGKPVPPERLRKLQTSIESAIEQIRRLSREFSPLELKGAGLMSALGELAEHLSVRAESKFVCKKPVFVADESVALGLYRVAQQLCRVPIDAAPGNRFVISLHEEKGWIVLEIVRIGECSPESGVLVRARMLALGGECSFHTANQTRTIELRVPKTQ
jgi:signal transduction histidine kinase